ncbi:MAG TPA: TIM barrel protein, partial [Isosphaeraceae bacterium]|nr:TIM barrel protein [Isosphaeraceae bacterium]
GHRYGTIASIRDAIKDHHEKIGCCLDTGHFLRSREDPVEAVEVFDRRIYGVHLKDVDDATRFTILGEGDLRLADLLKALAKRNYSYCLALEYEENPQNPIEDIRACLASVRKAVPKA